MRKFDENVFKEGTRYDPEKINKADQSLPLRDDSRKRPVSMMPMINDYQNPTKKNYSPQSEVGISKGMRTNENEKG